MIPRTNQGWVRACALVAALLLFEPGLALGLDFGPGQIVQAGGADIAVLGYSVPSFVDWNNDGRSDLVVGEGSGTYTGKVRVYLNTGTASSPSFQTYSYAKSNSVDLAVTGSGCMGLFPRAVQWDGDGRKDLLVGQADGRVKIYLNTGTDAAPTFDAGTFLQVGQPGAKTTLDVGDRATCSMLDWNNDGRRDLVGGSLDGYIRIFLNEGTDTAPDFRTTSIVQAGATNLSVSTGRSSPVIADFDGDGRKDLLTGNTEGQLFFYGNAGTDAAPAFSGYSAVTANGVNIDFAGSARSRPFVCDWTGDGRLDLLVGADDGKIHLYQGLPEPTTLGLLGMGLLLIPRRRPAGR
jgi:WD40 repeat protein